MDIALDTRTLLEDALGGLRRELKMDAQAMSLYIAERAAHLATLVGQKGFEQAVIAERDAVALKAAIEIGRTAAGIDQRLIGIIQSALLFGAKALAAA